MKNIKGIHDSIRTLAKKNRVGYFTPEQIDDAVNKASLDLFNDIYGLDEETHPQKQSPVVAYANNQKVLDDLQPFITDPVSLTVSSGIANLPSDYVRKSKISATINGVTRDVKVVTDDKWSFRINRKTGGPSLKNPVCRFFNNKLEFAPSNITGVTISYLKTPSKATYAYTMANNRPVYDDANSVDFEWKENKHQDIILRALNYLGVVLEDSILMQQSQLRKQTGK